MERNHMSNTTLPPTETQLSLRLNPGPEAIPAARKAMDGLAGLIERFEYRIDDA